MNVYGYATPMVVDPLNICAVSVGFDLAPPGYPLGMTAAPHKWGAPWLREYTARGFIAEGGAR